MSESKCRQDFVCTERLPRTTTHTHAQRKQKISYHSTRHQTKCCPVLQYTCTAYRVHQNKSVRTHPRCSYTPKNASVVVEFSFNRRCCQLGTASGRYHTIPKQEAHFFFLQSSLENNQDLFVSTSIIIRRTVQATSNNIPADGLLGVVSRSASDACTKRFSYLLCCWSSSTVLT